MFPLNNDSTRTSTSRCHLIASTLNYSQSDPANIFNFKNLPSHPYKTSPSSSMYTTEIPTSVYITSTYTIATLNWLYPKMIVSTHRLFFHFPANQILTLNARAFPIFSNSSDLSTHIIFKKSTASIYILQLLLHLQNHLQHVRYLNLITFNFFIHTFKISTTSRLHLLTYSSTETPILTSVSTSSSRLCLHSSSIPINDLIIHYRLSSHRGHF